MSEFIFGYGSNMCLGRLLAYNVRPDGTGEPARLDGYVLRLNKNSRKDGSGKGNLERDKSGVVWGVLYSIPDQQLAILDQGEGPGYKRIRVSVRHATGVVDAWAHVARTPSKDPLPPYSWYKRFLVEGARANGLPSDYIAMLEGIDAAEDPDKDRDQRWRKLTCELGHRVE